MRLSAPITPSAPRVNPGRIPPWFARLLRAAMKRDGNPVRPHSPMCFVLQKAAPTGLLDHIGTSKVNGRSVFVTEPYSHRTQEARTLADWLRCDLVVSSLSFHNPGNCYRYEFHEQGSTAL